MHPRQAATVILLRPPLEVLMVKRNPALGFMGGYWVFPGGKLEDRDGTLEQAARRELAEEVSISLAAETELIPFARWITPVGLPKRYDTSFYLALASAEEAAATPTVDDSEIVAFRWVSPDAVLADDSPLAFPTRKQLERLAGFSTAEAAIDASRGVPVQAVLPEIVHDDGRPAVVIPGSSDAPFHAPELPPRS